MDHAARVSIPLVGSSRKSNRRGLAANSTAMVSLLRCSTLKHWFSPGLPTMASAQGIISSNSRTSSHHASLAALLPVVWRSKAENCSASRTVVVAKCVSICSQYPVSWGKLRGKGWPSHRMEPEMTPTPEVRCASTFMRVVFPLPEEPIMAVSCPGGTQPVTLCNSRRCFCFEMGTS